MPVCIRITAIEGGSQRKERRMIRFLQQFKGVPELLGATGYLLLENLLVATVFQQETAFLKSPGDDDGNFLETERLENIVIGAVFERIHRYPYVYSRCDQDDGRIGRYRLYLAKQDEPSNLRQHQIGEHQIVVG